MTKTDRASMKSALELRAPFLDQDVMALFAATLSEKERIQRLQTKVFLKQYALRYLPDEIVHRKKRGLSLALSSWLREPLYEWAKSRLSSPLLERAPALIIIIVTLQWSYCRNTCNERLITPDQSGH